MTQDEHKPDKWHFFVLCKKCNERMDIGEAPSPEEALAARSVGVICRHCGFEYTYRGAEVGRVRRGRE
jgi:hypothetical protein